VQLSLSQCSYLVDFESLALVFFRQVVNILLDKENDRNEALKAQAFA
jgi:hypothetical protein